MSDEENSSRYEAALAVLIQPSITPKRHACAEENVGIYPSRLETRPDEGKGWGMTSSTTQRCHAVNTEFYKLGTDFLSGMRNPDNCNLRVHTKCSKYISISSLAGSY